MDVPRGLGEFVPRYLVFRVVSRPAARRRDAFVGAVRVRAVVVEEQYNGRRRFRIAGPPKSPFDHRAGLVLFEPHFNLTAQGIAAERHGLLALLNHYHLRRRRHAPVHFALEDFKDFGAALFPVLRDAHLRPVDERQRILERVRGNLLFVVVDLPPGCGRSRESDHHGDDRRTEPFSFHLHRLPPCVFFTSRS